MKQTAIDWLVEKLKENGVDFWQEEIEMIEEAKEMEKEQMHSNKIINILDEITYWDNCPEEYKETISLFTKQFKNK